MWRHVVAVSLLLLIVCASVARTESKTRNTGITGVIRVTPIRPGPVRAGSESPTAAPSQDSSTSLRDLAHIRQIRPEENEPTFGGESLRGSIFGPRGDCFKLKSPGICPPCRKKCQIPSKRRHR